MNVRVGAQSYPSHHVAMLLVVALSILVAGTRGAYADDPLPKPVVPEALAHFNAGNEAYNEARGETVPAARRAAFERAAKEYLAGVSRETKHHFTFYWNLGHTYRQLGEFTRADYYYRKFLEFAPARFGEHRQAAEDFQRQMKAELDKGATLASAPTEATPGEPSSDVPPQLRKGTKDESPPVGAAGQAWHADRLGWVLVGGGAVAMLTGGGFVLSGSSLYDQAADEDRQSVAADLRDRGEQRVLIGGIVGGVGVAVVAAGVIRLALTDDDPPPGPGIQVTVGPASFSVWGSF